MAFTSVICTGTITRSGSAVAGALVEASVSAAMTNSGVTAVQQFATVTDANGSFSLILPANNDVGTTPTGTYYNVVVHVAGTGEGSDIYQKWPVTISSAYAPTIDLLSIAHNTNPVPPSPITTGVSSTFAAQKKLIFQTDGSDNGSITRLIELHPTGSIVDRPWISWFDFSSSAQCAAIGAHNTLPVSEGGTSILQWELKTIADPASPNPGEMRTRIGVKYNTQRGIWGVNFIDFFEINQGENPPTTYPTIGSTQSTGLRVRTTDSLGTNAAVAQFIATIDASDNITGNLDVMNTGQTAKTANLIIGRNTNTSSGSGATIHIKKMDGSNTDVWQLNPRSSPPTNTLGYTGDTGFNIVVGSDTGLRIGTATTQKLSFFNAAPVAQPTAAAVTAGFTAGAGTAMNSASTSTGNTGATAYTFGDVVASLKTLGLIAS